LGGGGATNLFVVVEGASSVESREAGTFDFVSKVNIDGWFCL